MKNSQIGFIVPVLIFIIAVLGIAGGIYVYKNEKKPSSSVNQLETFNQVTGQENTQQVAANWKVYSNAKYGVSFSYPSNFKIVTDKIHQEYIGHPKGYNWYRIELSDTTAPEKPMMRLEIDPDGYGPFFADILYEVTETNDGKISNDSLFKSDSENARDGKMLIMPNMITSQNGHTYAIQFSYNEGGKDLMPLFNEILATVRFSK